MKYSTLKLILILSAFFLITFAAQSQNNTNTLETFEEETFSHWVWDTILVKPASTRTIELLPPVYETIEEQVMVKPGVTKIPVRPAVYEMQEERILFKEATEKWVPKINPETGEVEISEDCLEKGKKEEDCIIFIWQKVPAEYITVNKKVLIMPTSSPIIDIPPVYETVKKTILKSEGVYIEEAIPAEYKIVQRWVKTH